MIPVKELKTVSPVVCIKDTKHFFLFEESSNALLGIDRDTLLEEHRTDNLFEALAEEGVNLVIAPTVSKIMLSMIRERGMAICAPLGRSCAEAVNNIKDGMETLPKVI
ncbi:hypothetical protein [Spirochaeta cellobiosiphila]|uniref:hypothetical protein n=1 Tax=Spirochaeta cellobiosiphila TaxID=504483 RepID=UPI0012EBF5DE|nr:hypothetical protein [Spirochaeta cellobiosiphila]